MTAHPDKDKDNEWHLAGKKRNLRRTSKVRYLQEINWTRVKPQRSGVVVYEKRDDRLIFGMGIDRKYGDITDFGGGVSYRRDGSALHGALREFQEESLGVFGALSGDTLQKALAVYNSQLMIIFVPLSLTPSDTTLLFRQRLHPESEVSDLAWLSRKEFESLLSPSPSSSKRIYEPVRDLLSQAGTFLSLLS